MRHLSRSLKWRGNHFIDKTQTVEHKWYCALTEKGAKARPNRFEFSRQNNWSFLIVFSENTYFLQIFKMKTLWTFTALVLATLYHGSHQKPSQPSQSSSESKYCNFVDFLNSKSSVKLGSKNQIHYFASFLKFWTKNGYLEQCGICF